MIIHNDKEQDKIFYKKEELLKKFSKNNNEININNYFQNSEEEKYKPKILSILIIYYIAIIIIDSTMINIELYFSEILIIISSLILWLYCLLSIIKNDFKKDINKVIWIVLIFIFPIVIFIYPDFRKIQIIKK